MAALIFLGTKFRSWRDDGKVNAGGSVEFYAPGGTFTTAKDVYTDSTLDTVAGSIITLDAAGKADIWLSGNYDIIEKDADGVTLESVEGYNPPEAEVTGNYNLIDNGSFEIGADDATLPDSWDLVNYSGSTNVLDNTVSSHGAQSMKFTSVGSGGGYITSESFFQVSDIQSLICLFDLNSSVVNVRNLVQLLWYDEDQIVLSTPTTTLYDEDSTNPISWTTVRSTILPPSGARFAKLRMYGCHSSNSTSGSTHYDNVRLIVPDQVSSSLGLILGFTNYVQFY